MKNKDIGTKIAELRKAKGLTQEELSELCNINIRTLQRIEKGEVTPRSYTVNVILDKLNSNSEEHLSTDTKTSLPFFEWWKQKINTKKKIAILTTIVLIVGLGVFALTKFLTGNDDTTPQVDENKYGELQTNSITIIDVEVDDVPYNKLVVRLVEINNHDIFSKEGTFENGKLLFHLPEEMPEKYVSIILRNHTGVKRSDEDAKFAFAKLDGYDEAGKLVGWFEYRGEERGVMAAPFYANRDVTLLGEDNSKDIWFVSALVGWNMMYYEETDEGHIIMTTSFPEKEMKWRFRRRDN